jgi:uncharacterized RDD family membrane protein YckC
MRCPKCHYISFEPEPRCRNCGYGFSLGDAGGQATPAADDPLANFSLRDAQWTPAGRSGLDAAPADVNLDAPLARDPIGEVPSPAAASTMAPARASTPVPSWADDHDRIERPASRPTPPPRVPSARAAERPRATPPAPMTPAPPRPAAPPTTELPLFVKDIVAPADDAPVGSPVDVAPVVAPPPDGPVPPPLTPAMAAEVEERVMRPVEPRAPLSVRRSVDTPPARSRSSSPASRKLGPLDRDLLEDLHRIEKVEQREAAAAARADAGISGVGATRRLGAAALDALFVAALTTGLVWVTLRWCDLSFARAGVLPLAPMAAFMFLIVVGYLLLFTAAGGQTLGKMAAAIRVIGDEDGDETLTVGQAAARSVLTVPSVVALGAGFVPALFGDERAIHDRLAHTRVVRA